MAIKSGDPVLDSFRVQQEKTANLQARLDEIARIASVSMLFEHERLAILALARGDRRR